MGSDKKRRDAGTGSVSLMEDGRYKARFRYYSQTEGRTKNKTKLCKTEAEAKRFLKTCEREVTQFTFVSVKKETVQQFMLRWLNLIKKPDLKPTSFDRLEITLDNHIFPTIGILQIGAVDSSSIQSLLNKLKNEGKSYSTIKKVYDALNACFKWGVAGRLLQYNPIDAVVVPGRSKAKGKKSMGGNTNGFKYFSQDEQAKLVQAATETFPNGSLIYRFGYVIPFLLNTGLRLGELLALRWDRDVDIEARTLKIKNSIVLIKNRSEDSASKTVLLEQDSVKSGAGERSIYLNDEALAAILKIREITGSNNHVISTKQGIPVQPSNIERMIRSACLRAGISPDGRNAHALRHSFATNLFAQGIDIKIISALLGHSDIAITYNIYVHVIEEQKQDAVIMIGNKLASN